MNELWDDPTLGRELRDALRGQKKRLDDKAGDPTEVASGPLTPAQAVAEAIRHYKKKKEYTMPNDEFGIKALVDQLEELEKLMKAEEAEKDPEAKKELLDLIEQILSDPRVDDRAREMLQAQLAGIEEKLRDPDGKKARHAAAKALTPQALEDQLGDAVGDAHAAAKTKSALHAPERDVKQAQDRAKALEELKELAGEEDAWDAARHAGQPAPESQLHDTLEKMKKVLDDVLPDPGLDAPTRALLSRSA